MVSVAVIELSSASGDVAIWKDRFREVCEMRSLPPSSRSRFQFCVSERHALNGKLVNRGALYMGIWKESMIQTQHANENVGP